MTRSEKKAMDVAETTAEVSEQAVSETNTLQQTPDELFEITEKTYTEAEESLIQFVEMQVSNMRDNILFGGDETPSFYKLNRSLMEYESTLLALTALYAKTKSAADFAQEKYDDFYSLKYAETLKTQLSLGKSGSSQVKNIEMLVRTENITQLAALKANIIRCNSERDTISKLIDGWKNYQFVLGTLSKNAQAEAGAAGVANRNPLEFGDESFS
ncbi:MAG: hypothetical protein HUJ68_02765 [Clostridia bacterium]|nr:hypothetical protein [Clostridia bacterium]